MENDMKVQRFDSLPLDATYFTDEGYLVDHPIVTSVGIFVYHNPDGSERRELRLPEEVFAEKSLASYKGKPIIVTHDAGYVDTDNVKDESIGTILSEGYRDGDDVRAEIIIHDTDSLKSTKCVSCPAATTCVWTKRPVSGRGNPMMPFSGTSKSTILLLSIRRGLVNRPGSTLMGRATTA